MLEYQDRLKASLEMIPFQADLQGRQLNQVQAKISTLGEITDREALALLDDNLDELYKYLFYTSARYIKKLDEEKYSDLRYILFEEDPETQADSLNKYLGKTDNLKKLQKVFPVIITTCISAHRLGDPKPTFDMVIIDEASQCNTAVSLVPIIRGENLMLVGDPQQLSPVILLDEITNQKLRKRYHVADEYDYRKNSIYKTFLACDAVSDEVLLHNHYRCNRKIIEFNNKKYYHSRLNICSGSGEQRPLVYMDVKSSQNNLKNTADQEVNEIVRYARANRDKSVGVITPFANQKKLIEEKGRLDLPGRPLPAERGMRNCTRLSGRREGRDPVLDGNHQPDAFRNLRVAQKQ